MIVKVKEPQPAEYAQLKADQLLFTISTSPRPGADAGLLASGCTAIAHERLPTRAAARRCWRR